MLHEPLTKSLLSKPPFILANTSQGEDWMTVSHRRSESSKNRREFPSTNNLTLFNFGVKKNKQTNKQNKNKNKKPRNKAESDLLICN